MSIAREAMRSRKRQARPSFWPAASGMRVCGLEREQRADVVVLHRLLEERERVRLERAREARGVEAVEAAVRVDVQIDLEPDRVAHRAHAARVLGDHFLERPRLVAPGERVLPDHHLQPRMPATHPPFRRRGKLVAAVGAEAEGGVHGHARARRAEEAPHRLPELLALEVPERDVERGDGVARVAGLPARRQQPVQPLPDALVRERVFLGGKRMRHDLVQRRGDHLLFGDRGHAVAHLPVLRLDFHEAHRERGLLDDPGRVQAHRHVERRCADAHLLDLDAGVVHHRRPALRFLGDLRAELRGRARRGRRALLARRSPPRPAKSRALRTSAERRWMTFAGVPAGATRNTFGAALKPGSVSAIAGQSGALGRRCGLVTASVRMRPRLGRPHRRERADHADRHLAVHDVRHHRRRALVGHVQRVDAGRALEQLEGEVLQRADARRGVAVLARDCALSTAISSRVLCAGKRRVHHERHRQHADAADRRELLHRVEASRSDSPPAARACRSRPASARGRRPATRRAPPPPRRPRRRDGSRPRTAGRAPARASAPITRAIVSMPPPGA